MKSNVMSERDTGLRVTLPLVWRGDELWIGPMFIGWVELRQEGYAPLMQGVSRAQVCPCLPTRAEAERAVERAVMEGMG